MADTRCANPGYQFDVDIMMIEYVLYKAIEAQIQLLRSLSADGASTAVIAPAEKAVRLTETFDIIANLFERNHGHKQLSTATELDAATLRFLTVLNMWLQNRSTGLQGPTLAPSPDMQANLRRDQLINTFFRQRWICTRSEGNSSPVIGITSPSSRHCNPQLSLSAHLVPLFLSLSYKLQPPEAILSEKWIYIASEFMVNAAIEVLDAPEIFYGCNGEVGLKARLDTDIVRAAIEECFAWGYVVRSRFGVDSPLAKRVLTELEGAAPDLTGNHANNDGDADQEANASECERRIRETLEREDEVWEMFYDTGGIQQSNGDGDGNDDGSGRSNGGSKLEAPPQSSGEISGWTRMREESLDAVMVTYWDMVEASAADEEARRESLRWLKNRYRLSGLLEDLALFIETSWKKLHGPGWHEKPVLVQIEEGGLAGLSKEDFVDFKRRAGIEDARWFGEAVTTYVSP